MDDLFILIHCQFELLFVSVATVHYGVCIKRRRGSQVECSHRLWTHLFSGPIYMFFFNLICFHQCIFLACMQKSYILGLIPLLSSKRLSHKMKRLLENTADTDPKTVPTVDLNKATRAKIRTCAVDSTTQKHRREKLSHCYIVLYSLQKIQKQDISHRLTVSTISSPTHKLIKYMARYNSTIMHTKNWK